MQNYGDYVEVCKRVNNAKRSFLVLNKAQCKHFPSSPTIALQMFNDLASRLGKYMSNKSVLVVGFAETATAIGAGVATRLRVDYVNTTREDFDADFIEFTESHSHATEQKLIKADFSRYRRIIFVEDEVTTGNTILKLVDKLLGLYPNLKFSVASILNGMSEAEEEVYQSRNIELKYLVKLDNSDYEQRVSDVKLTGKTIDLFNSKPDSRIICYYSGMDTRKVVDIESYNRHLETIYKSLFVKDYGESVLVLGTEECMYPAIMIGAELEKRGCVVNCHSTTRSPIGVVDETDSGSYPLNEAYKLNSCYDYERETYLYNLAKYDTVYIVTDADENSNGMKELILLLRTFGNDDIVLVALEG